MQASVTGGFHGCSTLDDTFDASCVGGALHLLRRNHPISPEAICSPGVSDTEISRDHEAYSVRLRYSRARSATATHDDQRQGG